MKPVIFQVISVMLTMSCISVSSIDQPEYSETRQLNIAAEDIEMLGIDCGAGFLKVEGDENTDKIEVIAEIHIKAKDDEEAKQFIDKHLDLQLKNFNEKAILNCHFENQGNNINGWVNLTVRIPKKIDLSIDDGSGFAEVNTIDGSLYFKDGSGELNISDISGNVKVIDGSGELTIEHVGGNLKVDDGSGTLTIKDVKKDLNIVDGSGEINISDIVGNVVVRDGSGSIDLNNISGNVDIPESGSGSVYTHNIHGNLYKDED